MALPLLVAAETVAVRWKPALPAVRVSSRAAPTAVCKRQQECCVCARALTFCRTLAIAEEEEEALHLQRSASRAAPSKKKKKRSTSVTVYRLYTHWEISLRNAV